MAKTKSQFDVHPGVAMVKKWIADLPDKTGRSLDQWSDVYRKLAKKHPVRKDLVAAIKNEYGLGTVTAEQIWEYTFNSITWEGDDSTYLKNAEEYVNGQYAGAREQFKPLFDEVVRFARTLGKDVRVCPCKTMVPLYRGRVFAELRAATNSRFEIALCMTNVPYDELLKKNPRAKGNDRQLYVINLQATKDFNSTVKKWLKHAYSQNEKAK